LFTGATLCNEGTRKEAEKKDARKGDEGSEKKKQGGEKDEKGQKEQQKKGVVEEKVAKKAVKKVVPPGKKKPVATVRVDIPVGTSCPRFFPSRN
jgi:hypothetical protein